MINLRMAGLLFVLLLYLLLLVYLNKIYIIMNKRYITKSGLENLKKELEELKNKRAEIVERIKTAKELGDLKENAEYSEARDAQALNEAKILEVKEILKSAEVLENNGVKNDIAGIGSMITVKSKDKTKNFELVGASEAKPLEGKISIESPLGQAFLGHRANDEVTIKVPKGDIKYKILEIK